MEHITELQSILQAHLSWHKARLNFLARFLLALIQQSTVNLTEVALALNGRVRNESNYRRIQRFLSDFDFDADAFARLLLFLVPQRRLLLTLDRTQWQFGQHEQNILMLAVAHQGMALPILWTVIPGRGCSSTAQRIALLSRFLQLVPAERIEALLADREFIGKEWFAFLLEHKIPFRIRVKYDLQVTSRRNSIVSVGSLFTSLRLEQFCVLRGRRAICGQRLYIAGKRILGRTKKGELLIVVTDAHPHTALQSYARRWEIETLFAALKSRGFDLESTHLSHPERLEKLLACLALAAVWAHHVGEWVHRVVQPVRMKKTHGRRAKSLFRLGLDQLRSILFHQPECAEALRICFHLLRRPGVLSCT